MFKSKGEAHLKPSTFKSKSCILGMGNGFLLILLLSSLKSGMIHTVLVFLEIIYVGATHSKSFLCLKDLSLLIDQLLF